MWDAQGFPGQGEKAEQSHQRVKSETEEGIKWWQEFIRWKIQSRVKEVRLQAARKQTCAVQDLMQENYQEPHPRTPRGLRGARERRAQTTV